MSHRKAPRNTVAVLLCITLAAGALLCGCTSAPKHAATLEVPFHAQTATNHCGATALSMALDYFGAPYNPTNLDQEVFVPLLHGSPMQLLEESARHRGLHAVQTNLDIKSLHSLTAAGSIAIIYLKPFKGSVGHFAVVTGVADNLKMVRIHCQTKPDCWIKSSRLQKHSSDNRFPALVLRKKES